MIHNPESDATITSIITTMVHTVCAPVALDPPGDNPMGDSEGDPEPPDRPRRISLYALLGAECQAELDARMVCFT